MYSCRSSSVVALSPILLLLMLVGCSGGAPEAPPPPEASNDPQQQPGDIPIQLTGTLQFTSEEFHEEGSETQGMKYSRHFSAQCSFKQPATMWTNPETHQLEFQLSEAEPGVLKSEFTGGAEATGDSRLADLIHKPSIVETSTVRLRGGLTQCLIRRLDAAQFGPEKQPAHDITIDFQATLSGTAQTQHTSDGATDIRKSGGQALTLVLEAPPGDESQEFTLVNDPSNTGAHLHASPLQMRPTLGPRPQGDDAEIKLQQEVYDGLAKHPESAWLGLVFDPEQKVWTYAGSHITGAGAKHTLNVRIQVVSEQPH